MSHKEKAHRYSNIKILLHISKNFLLILYLIIFQFSNLSHLLKESVYKTTANQYLVISIYFVILAAVYYIISFPLNYFSTYSLEHRFSLSNQKLSSWLKDEVKSIFLNLVISLILIQVLYIFLHIFYNSWWIWMALFWVLFTIILSRIFPTLIIPLFYKYNPLQNKELRERLIKLAEDAGIKVLDTYEIDFSKKTKKANAALAGWGKTRRIILADNLLKDFTDDEIEVVVGHEIAHYKLYHIWKMLFVGGALSFLIFYIAHIILIRSLDLFGLTAIYDIELFPFLCLVLLVFSFLILPLQNGFSRRLERTADGFTLKLTRNKTAFISLMNKLAERNLADVKPNKFIEFIFYNHPSISKRIRFAKEFS